MLVAIGSNDSELAMLRWTFPLLIAIAAIGPAAGADESVAVRDRQHPPAAHPSSQPRYKFKTTIAPEARYASRRHRAPAVDETSELLFTPANGALPYIPPLIRAPLLPGSNTLPGYYGSPNNYDYPGPYYGGPNLGYFFRLPYACGVYGYC
jgi:hypothetical protein